MSGSGDQQQDLAVATGLTCPSDAVLVAFAEGKLPERDLTTVAMHLHECATCESAVRGYGSAADSLASVLRAAVHSPAPLEEPACLRLQAAARAIVPPRDESATAETELDAGTGESASVQERAVTATAIWSPALPASIGRYVVRSLLGRGGFGAVYLAHDPDLDRLVAIKVPRFEGAASSERIEWFLQEAKSAARLKHPGIVSVYEVGRQDDGSCYIVMEYVEGESLAVRMSKGPLPREQIIDIVRQTAEAIAYAHKKGLVHRDLKPGNILLDADGRVKIADFGLAVHEDQQRNRAGELAGTLAYMSPEQVRRDVHRLDGRSDIWALGVILYELLTRRRPFAGTKYEVADEIQHRSPKPPRQIDDTIPPELERVCLKCLAKDADLRYSSAADMARELGRLTAPPTPSYLRSRVMRWATVAGVLLASAVVLYSVTSSWRRNAPYQVDNVAKPFVPLRLLDRPPEELFPPGSPDEQVWYDEQFERLKLDAPTRNIVGLGESHSGWFKLSVKLTKSEPRGSAGIFLGYHPLPSQHGKPSWKFQFICVRCNKEGAAVIQRMTMDITKNNAKSWTQVATQPLAATSIPAKPVSDSVLEVTVKANQIREVLWEGRPLPQLADPKPDQFGNLAGCTGRFGLINSAGSTTFSEAEFTSLRSDDP